MTTLERVSRAFSLPDVEHDCINIIGHFSTKRTEKKEPNKGKNRDQERELVLWNAK